MHRMALLCALLPVLGGCTYGVRVAKPPVVWSMAEPIPDVIVRDSTWLRVVALNDSPYFLEIEAVFPDMPPHSIAVLNAECRGTFNGVAHAKKVIGASLSGAVLEVANMGERAFALRVDGRNQKIRGIEADAYIIFTEHSYRLYNTITGSRSHVLLPPLCSFFVPEVTLEFPVNRPP